MARIRRRRDRRHSLGTHGLTGTYNAHVVRIPLHARDGSLRAYAVVDDCDRATAELGWCLDAWGYVVRRGEDGRIVRLHRLLLGLAPGDAREGDHENRDRLDNRRENLRIVTRAQQMHNVSPRPRSSTYRGVSFCRQTGRWRATAQVGGRWKHLGRFDSEEDAAAAARAFREREMSHAVD